MIQDNDFGFLPKEKFQQIVDTIPGKSGLMLEVLINAGLQAPLPPSYSSSAIHQPLN